MEADAVVNPEIASILLSFPLAIHHVVNPEMNAEEPSITHKKEMTPINNLSMAWTFPFLSLVVQAQEGCVGSSIVDR